MRIKNFGDFINEDRDFDKYDGKRPEIFFANAGSLLIASREAVESIKGVENPDGKFDEDLTNKENQVLVELAHIIFYDILKFEADKPNPLKYKEAPGVFVYEEYADDEAIWMKLAKDIAKRL